jgi:hypothetical protein
MATRSLIGKYTNNNTWKYIYCHWDGNPEYNGKVLIENYTTEEDVNKLLELGDLVSLGKFIERTDPSQSDSDITIAYHRDRYQEYSSPAESDSNIKTIKSCIYSLGCDYCYIFDPTTNKWQCKKYNWSKQTIETIDLYLLED